MSTSVRRNISQPEEWWDAFERAAKAEKLTLSEWLGLAALDRLPSKVRKGLPTRPPAHRPAAENDDTAA